MHPYTKSWILNNIQDQLLTATFYQALPADVTVALSFVYPKKWTLDKASACKDLEFGDKLIVFTFYIFCIDLP